MTTGQLAITAGAIGALLEYPLAGKYPLASPVSRGTRMLVAGALVTISVLVAERVLRRQGT